jgi:hypothetical protein
LKLKERLAKEYTQLNHFGALPLHRRNVGKAYIAGFDQAKKLLRALEPFQGRSWFEIPMKELDDLGEEDGEEKTR